MKKHELQDTFEDKFCVLLERASRNNGESSQFWSDAITDFFWNEIQQIRKEDMERVSKVIKGIKCEDPKEIFEIQHNDTISEILAIIKQDE